MSVSKEPNKMLCKDLFKVGSQKGKVIDRRALASKLSIYHMIPEISDIPDKDGNLALMYLLSVLHEDRVKTSLSQQVNKLTLCFSAMSMF